MDCSTQYLPYESTGFFSKIVQDYLQQHENLKPFYLHDVNADGVQSAIAARDQHPINRTVLVETLQAQYQGLPITEKLQQNLGALSSDYCYTITTAHQPNIFTGPLYFIYKIIHTIQLADELNKLLPQKQFVPVYYMGSEDADLEELGFVNIGGEKLIWDTKQTGAVGRMLVDKAFINLIDAIAGQIGVWPFGNELVSLFAKCYTIGKSIQQATLELVNALFGAFGLVVLLPDQPSLKALFAPVIAKELTTQFSQKTVSVTIDQLQQHYKVQAAGRPINLFYLIDDKRERIEWQNGQYEVAALGLTFSESAILQELANHPERFSPNVILRGAYQETILPNIIFIGGGGELAYWLELKSVFEAAGVAYPMLMLRNSFAILTPKLVQKQNNLQINDLDLFLPEHQLINQYVNNHTAHQLDLTNELASAAAFYEQLAIRANTVDQSLNDHVQALGTKAIKKIQALETKIRRAEKAKFSTATHQIHLLKQGLFPNNSLQERQDNFALLYAQYGPALIEQIYQSSKGLEPAFGLIKIQS